MMDDCVKKTGLRILSYGETGFRHFIASRPIKSAADVKNMKLRVMESPIYVTMMKAFGAAPTPIPWPETYTAVQQKVVDGLELPIPAYMMAKMYEVAKYLTLDGHSYSVDFLLINEKFFQSLPARTQNIIKSAAISAAIGGRGIHQLDSALGMAKMKDLGVQVYFPTPVELEGFKAAAQKPVMDYIAQQVGNKWVDDVLKAVKQAEAELAQY
jgi:TRAP-type C4-dicarboxylate transport system substrate-binding protein